MLVALRRWWLRRGGKQCLLVFTEASGRIHDGEVLTAAQETFVVTDVIRLSRRPGDILRRWEVWAIRVGQSKSQAERGTTLRRVTSG